MCIRDRVSAFISISAPRFSTCLAITLHSVVSIHLHSFLCSGVIYFFSSFSWKPRESLCQFYRRRLIVYHVLYDSCPSLSSNLLLNFLLLIEKTLKVIYLYHHVIILITIRSWQADNRGVRCEVLPGNVKNKVGGQSRKDVTSRVDNSRKNRAIFLYTRIQKRKRESERVCYLAKGGEESTYYKSNSGSS